MTEPTTILVPESQRANALAGFLGLEEQPTKECVDVDCVRGIAVTIDGYEVGPCHVCDESGRVPLVSGDKVRFVTEEREWNSVIGEYRWFEPLLRDGQPVEGEVTAVVAWENVGRVGNSWEPTLTNDREWLMLPADAFDSLAGCSWVLLWKETT